jgi:hypothetical protein
LFVADRYNHRILIYNTIPTSNGASADVVIGQPNMTSNTANRGGSAGANTLYYPYGVYGDGTRLFVADRYNHRVLIYNINYTTPSISSVMFNDVSYSSGMTVSSAPVLKATMTDTGGIGIQTSNLKVIVDSTVNTYANTWNTSIDTFEALTGQLTYNFKQGMDVGTHSVKIEVCNYFGTWVTSETMSVKVESESPYASTKNIKFDGITYKSGDIIRNTPNITATLKDNNGTPVAGSTLRISFAPATTTSSMKTMYSIVYTYSDFTGTDSYDSTTGLLSFTPKMGLSKGTYTMSIQASSAAGIVLTWETTGLEVMDTGAALQTIGTPLNYPNPFKPSTQTTDITYTLNVDGNTSVYIFDMHGRLIWKRDYGSGTMGGKAGYNTVTWDGKDDFGNQVGNGIYPFRIVSQGKVIGKGKIAVIE